MPQRTAGSGGVNAQFLCFWSIFPPAFCFVEVQKKRGKIEAACLQGICRSGFVNQPGAVLLWRYAEALSEFLVKDICVFEAAERSNVCYAADAVQLFFCVIQPDITNVRRKRTAHMFVPETREVVRREIFLCGNFSNPQILGPVFVDMPQDSTQAILSRIGADAEDIILYGTCKMIPQQQKQSSSLRRKRGTDL